MTSDPCFRCSLPDCDEGDRRCRLRQLHARYLGKRRRGLMHLVSAEERAASNRLRHALKIEHAALAAEGVA